MYKTIEKIENDATDDVAFTLQDTDFAIVLSGFSLYSILIDNLSHYQLLIARNNKEEGYMYDLVTQKLVHNH